MVGFKRRENSDEEKADIESGFIELDVKAGK
jgi:hypothetical protein